jgi:hypothetical protein
MAPTTRKSIAFLGTGETPVFCVAPVCSDEVHVSTGVFILALVSPTILDVAARKGAFPHG